MAGLPGKLCVKTGLGTGVCALGEAGGGEFCVPLLLPRGSDLKESTCKVEDLGSIPGVRRSPGGGHGNPLQYSCQENLHGQRSLVGYCPWGCKESHMTERLST